MATHASPLPHPFFRPDRAGGVALVGPRELQRLLEGNDPPVLVDVRPLQERRLARLAPDRHVPLSDLPRFLAELPRDRPVVLYDQFGAQARRAGEYLAQQGFPLVVALEGGLDEYSRVADPSIPRYSVNGPDAQLLLCQIPRPAAGCLTYLLVDPSSRAAVIVDPGREVGPYRQLLAEGGWKLSAIVETHTHADHLAGHGPLHAATDAPIYLSHRSEARYPHRTLTEGEAITFGAEEIVALETPGHTPDHLTLHVRDKIFTGDTLLLGSCGRTDLGSGSPELLWESLTEKILPLPRETEVYPAHFGAHHALPERTVSTVGFEAATNEALLQGSREAFLRYMTEGWPPKPKDFDAIVRENLEE